MAGPGQPILANAVDINKRPSIKVILIKQDLKEFQDLLDKGWKIASTFPHAQGALFLLMKD